MPFSAYGEFRQISREVDLGRGVFNSRCEGRAQVQGFYSAADLREKVICTHPKSALRPGKIQTLEFGTEFLGLAGPSTS
jgi:hypothetical protein